MFEIMVEWLKSRKKLPFLVCNLPGTTLFFSRNFSFQYSPFGIGHLPTWPWFLGDRFLPVGIGPNRGDFFKRESYSKMPNTKGPSCEEEIEKRHEKTPSNSITIGEVVRHAIIPLTKHKKSSYVQVQKHAGFLSGEIFDVSMDDAKGSVLKLLFFWLHSF